MKKRVIICSILLIIWTTLVLTNNMGWFDEPIYDFLISFKSYPFTRVMKIFTFFASDVFIIAMCVLSLLGLLWKRKGCLCLLGMMFFSTGFNLILKVIFRRDRPDHLALVTEDSFSYPSGHAMASVAFYGTLLVLVKYSNVKNKLLIYLSTIILILCIGISRVYLGVHYPSDIVGGWLFGYLFVCLLDYIVGGYYEGTIKWSK